MRPGTPFYVSDQLIEPADDLRLIGSAPLPVCSYARGRQGATVTGPEYYSVMPSRKAKLFGFHLDLTVTLDKVVDQWMLVPTPPPLRQGPVAACGGAVKVH